jgi:hypothetical protein
VQKIPLVLACPGMVIARDVMKPDNPEGFPVCGKGALLSGSLIERFRRIGIQSIIVEGHPVIMEGEISTEEQLAALEKRFRKTSEDPIMTMIKEKFQIHIIRSVKD